MNHRLQTSITVCGRKLPLGDRSLIMGVLNVTPDSFSDGGLYFNEASAIRHGISLARAGADWIDVGGESTRPGAVRVSAAEEIRRVVPVIRGIHKKLPRLPISIDTTKAEVAEAAVGAGARMLNDVSGLRFDPGIARVAAKYRLPLILMHLRGRPQTMQRKPFVKSIWRSIGCGLERSIRLAQGLGVRRAQLIVDPGLGFGKSRGQNFEILANLQRLNRFGLPILVGTSRKSFVQAVAAGHGAGAAAGGSALWPLIDRSGFATNVSRRDRVRRVKSGTQTPALLDAADAAMTAAAILGGAHILRVHNPAAVLPAARLADALLAAE